MIKIGLEYEGVIKKDNKIVRWMDLSSDIQKKIQSDNKIPPVDNYDCLAEVRTFPLTNPNEKSILNELFDKIENLNNIFIKNGLTIDWNENIIPENLHKSIINNMKHLDGVNKKYKETYTLDGNGSKLWLPIHLMEDKRRGGGLHINVSGLNKECIISFVCALHSSLEHLKDKTLCSQYRQQILYRDKYIGNERVYEYMSFGFHIPTKMKIFNFYKYVKHCFHWMKIIIDISKKYENIE